MDELLEQGFVEQDTALESMRASDFDCYSAYGEVIDNSIQAFATEIKLQFIENADRKGGKAKNIEKVLFADNGHGMDVNLLHKCLKLGHSSRYNDRNGIGRFGVGMTLGGIHECRKLEVYSKVEGGGWYYTYIDLDEIASGELKYIPKPILRNPETNVVDYIEKSGTLVIWSKYDKQVDPYEKIIEESIFWIGRTFRKFIWGHAKGYDKVAISLNGEKINAFDPLFYIKDLTGFEDEEASELYPPQTVDWKIPLEVKSKKQKSTIIINISLLPDSYRRMRGQGGDSFAKERYIDRNEGISILRNDREVFFGHIPHTTILGSGDSLNINRYIGCEICFNAELDSEFSVKNIKRGAIPIRDLKKEIVERIHPTFKTLTEKIRNSWNEKDRDKDKENNITNAEIGVSGTHNTTNKFLKEIKTALLNNNKAGDGKNDQIIAKKVNPKASNDEIDLIINGLRENGITIDEREFIGDTFIDIEHGNQLKTLIYNTNSTFYKVYNEILSGLRVENEELADKYRLLLDLIFVGYMLAESNIDPDEKMDAGTFSNELKQYWAINMTKMLKKWSV